MRITNNTILQSQLRGLQSNIAALEQANQQITSGLRFQTAADDPTAANGVMGTDSALRALDQYRTNIGRATSRVQTEDTALSQLNDLLVRAKELGVSQATDASNTQTRAAAASELQEIFKQVISIANTKFGNEYLFGGDASTTQPFAASGAGPTLDYTTTNPQGQRTIEIGSGQRMTVGHDGHQVFLNTGALDALRDLAHAMDPTSPSYGRNAIATAMTSLDAATNSVQTLVGEVGARENELTSSGQNLDAFKTNLSALKSNLQDIDLETAITELTTRQNAYQAAMLATSKVVGPSLTDYLR